MALSSTKRALNAVAVLVCVAAVGGAIYLYRSSRPLPAASKGAAPGIFDQLPADAPVVAYIDVASLRKLQNPAFADLFGLTEAGNSGRSKQPVDREYAQFVRGTGFDYTRDLDHAAIAVWPTDLSPADNDAGANPSLAIADGRFDQRKIVAYALRVGGRPETVGGHEQYVVPGKPTVAFEFLSPTRIVIASGKRPEDLLNRPGANGSTADPAAQARVQRVAGAPIFAVVRTRQLPADFYANFNNSPQLESVIRNIQSLSISGQPQGDQIQLTADAECTSMTNAIELSTLLDTFRVLGEMSLSDPKVRRQMQMTREQAEFTEALVQQAKISHQDRWVRIALDITPAMLGAPQPHRRAKAN